MHWKKPEGIYRTNKTNQCILNAAYCMSSSSPGLDESSKNHRAFLPSTCSLQLLHAHIKIHIHKFEADFTCTTCFTTASSHIHTYRIGSVVYTITSYRLWIYKLLCNLIFIASYQQMVYILWNISKEMFIEHLWKKLLTSRNRKKKIMHIIHTYNLFTINNAFGSLFFTVK